MRAKTRTRGERVVAFIERYCRIPEGAHVGKPMRLDGFQKKFILEVYDNPHGTRRAILSIARKNGKSGLIAALLLAHLVGPEAVLNSQIVSGARSRDQAALVFSLAAKMVQLSPELSRLIRIVPSGKRLIGLKMNVEYRALAADGTTAHGLSPVLAILDELGQVRGPQDDFVDAITTSQGAHDAPLLIAISTQAPTDADLLSIWIDDAKRSADPSTVCHVYTAPEDCALDDPNAWASANPALGTFRNRRDVEEQAQQAVRMPSAENTFRNLVLNQRIATHSPFISRSVWLLNGGDVEQGDGPVYAGLDLSSRKDLTAFILVRSSGGVRHVTSMFWTPADTLRERSREDRVDYELFARQGFLRTTPGMTVDYDHVIADIAEAVDGLELASVAYDRWKINEFRAALQRAGVDLPLIEHGQGFRDMAPAIDALEADLLNARIAHGGHPVLALCAANAVVNKDPAGNRKLDKAKSTGRIDGMVALAMAYGAMGKAEPDVGPSVYEARGLLFL